MFFKATFDPFYRGESPFWTKPFGRIFFGSLFPSMVAKQIHLFSWVVNKNNIHNREIPVYMGIAFWQGFLEQMIDHALRPWQGSGQFQQTQCLKLSYRTTLGIPPQKQAMAILLWCHSKNSRFFSCMTLMFHSFETSGVTNSMQTHSTISSHFTTGKAAFQSAQFQHMKIHAVSAMSKK